MPDHGFVKILTMPGLSRRDRRPRRKRPRSDRLPGGFQAVIERTERDHELLDTLCHRVPVLTVGQVGATWWADADDPRHHARRRIRALGAGGFVDVSVANVVPTTLIASPLARWIPGDATWDASDITKRLEGATQHGKRRRTRFVHATEKARAHYGGHSHPVVAGDDDASRWLRVASVYLSHFLPSAESERVRWIGSRGSPRAASLGFDAIVTAEEGGESVVTGIFVAQSIDTQHIMRLHEQWAYAGTRHELW